MKQLPLLLICIMTLQMAGAQSLVVDRHSVALFDSIPPAYKDSAAKLRMLFMDRSVGGNISQALDCLSQPWASAPNYCKRYEHTDSIYNVDPMEVYWDGVWDRSRWKYEFWPSGCPEDVQCFIDFATPVLDSFDVLGCQFSYLAVMPGSGIADTLTGFFGSAGNNNKASTLAAFAAANPDKKIIWWTTSLARSIGTPESEAFNDQMRDYAQDHDIILFDVADILSHNPAGLPCYDNRDGVPYKTENYPDDSLDIPAICPQYTTETDGGHLGSISAGGIRVAKAFWVLMARLAGWSGPVSGAGEVAGVPVRIFPNPASDVLYISAETGEITSTLIVTDLAGRTLFSLGADKMPRNEGERIAIPVRNWQEGIYWVRFQSRGGTKVEKVVVLH